MSAGKSVSIVTSMRPFGRLTQQGRMARIREISRAFGIS
jgi:hypothetical protein